MNLYIESLAEYLITEWDHVLTAVNGPREARFVVQSLDPYETFALFKALDIHRIKWLTQHQIECHFKVATGLWKAWQSSYSIHELDTQMERCGSLGAEGERLWIDEEDKLTWYRGRTKSPNSYGLVVVLLGFNHATDQGGLADFHRVDETRIWRKMGESFVPWLKRIIEHYDLNAVEADLEQFDTVLQQLFLIRPLRLGKLADFLNCRILSRNTFTKLTELAEQFFEQLSFWDIPPLFTNQESAALRGKKGAAALKEADEFISHRRYKSASGRKSDWDKISNAISELELTLPITVNNEQIYEDINAYSNTLHAFIFKADAAARSRLLKTDLMPLLSFLQKKVTRETTSKTIPAIKGMSFEVLLQGIWKTLEEFSKKCGHQPLFDQLSGIHVELVRFDHDLTDDSDGGLGTIELGRSLLQGCLGGLDAVFERIDCRLPQDEDQSSLPRAKWDRNVPITLDLNLNGINYGTSRARPNVQFKVTITNYDLDLTTEGVFKWLLGPTQPERVRFECTEKLRERWSQIQNPERMLPAFRIPSVAMTALYFAADEEEANRLVAQAMADLELVNLLEGLSSTQIDATLWELTTNLITAYRKWLDSAINDGYYTARAMQMPRLLSIFIELAEKVLDTNLLGSEVLLRRFYKAFLLIDERVNADAPYLPGAIAWGLSPAVLELTQAKVGFLADGFPETVAELSIGGNGRIAFERLLDLAQIHRPLAALVVDTQQLSAAIKSFGLLHYFGPEPSTNNSLAVQALLRNEGSDDDEDVSGIVRPCEERDLVTRVLNDYQQLYPFAEDGLRILAVNVRELQTILSGLDLFLGAYLERTSPDWPPFHCTVMVYSTSSSPIAMENRLTLWRNHVADRQRENGRPLILSVGHRYAPKDQIISLLKKEQRQYDIAFLFHFLRGDLVGKVDPAMPFNINFDGWNGLQFPITEYPRPIQVGDRFRRKSLLSNRRLRIQTRHADMSARLYFGGNKKQDNLIFGHVDYEPWKGVVEELHLGSQWVACVDPFVDKRLLCGEDGNDQRKIVGFESGLGAYGEINLTISTEQDTLKQLTDQVRNKLTKLMPFEQTGGFESMAARVVNEAEEIIGLSSLRAVVGVDERIREVVGFAAIRRALPHLRGHMSQLLPVDSLLHWFIGSDVTLRPDLLQLTLEVRPNDIPLVHAVVVECKLAQKNLVHLAKAKEQIQEGLQHLTGLLAPNHSELRRSGFDRRYWWAQLHRAMTSRSVVTLPDNQWRELDHALEKLAEGDFEIQWQAAIFTFWTNEPGLQLEETLLTLPAGTVQPPFIVPENFVIRHLELGYKGLSALFAEASSQPLIELNGPVISLRPSFHEVSMPADAPILTPAIELDSTPEQRTSSIVDSKPILTPEPLPIPALTSELTPVQISVDISKPDSIPAAPPVIKPASVVGRPTVVLVPEKILIGTRANKDPVYWHFGHPQLANRHLLIFGTSGSGKTYAIQCLLAEIARQQLHSIIIDYTDGFYPPQVEKKFSEIALPKNHFVKTERLPLNPFRRQTQVIDPSIPAIEESPFDVATRIASIFTSVYETMGDQQTATLIRVLESGIEGNDHFTLNDMLSLLREEKQYGESLASKIEPLVKSEPFRVDEGSAWDSMLNSPDNWVHVLQLRGMPRDIQKMITEFALWDLWDYVQSTGDKTRPIPVVLDEIQNLDHSSDSPIDKMLREGRKFGLSLILATQTTSQFNPEQRDRLFQAAHKLFFKPASTEIDRFAQILSQSTGVSKADWGQRLANLEKGQCWSLGPVVKSGGTFKEEPLLVNVTSLEQRKFEY